MVYENRNLISNYSAAITQSTTFAAEASIQNVPTLLISKAERGFLSELKTRNVPIIVNQNGVYYKAWFKGDYFARLAQMYQRLKFDYTSKNLQELIFSGCKW